MPRPGRLVGLDDVPAGEVRRADVQHLALLHEQVHGLPDLVPGRVPVDVVHLVQVDVVGLHPPQRALAGPADVQRRQLVLVGPVAHRPVQLGRQDHLVAAPAALGEPAADDLLGDALALLPAVDVGGVEEVDALLEGPVHDRVGVLLGGLRTEVHRAQAQPADQQPGPSEMGVLHVLAPAVRRHSREPAYAGRHVRHPLRPAPGHLLAPARPRAAVRGPGRRRPPRGPPGPAGGGRQLQGGEGLHRPGARAVGGGGGHPQPHPGPAGGQDRPRGAGRHPGRAQRAPPVVAPAPDGGADGRPPGLGQDHHRGQAGPLAGRQGPQAAAGRLRPPAPGGRQAAPGAGRAGQGPGVRPPPRRPGRRPGAGRPRRPRRGRADRARRGRWSTPPAGWPSTPR